MAVGIMILSNEGGKQVATMVAANPAEAKELGETFPLPAYRYMSIAEPKSTEWLSRAWGRMSGTWEEGNAGTTRTTSKVD